MAFQMIQRSTLPVSTRGQVSTEPKIAIRENGQVAFNKLAAGAMGSPELMILQFDSEKRMLVFKPYFSGKTALPKGAKKEVFEADLFKLSYGNKTKVETPYFAAAQLLKDLKYDYAASGNQIFMPLVKDNALVITLPEGSLTPKPKTERKKKDPATKNGPVKNIPVERNSASTPATDGETESTENMDDFEL